MSGIEICRKLFEQIKGEKDKLGFSMPHMTPPGSDLGAESLSGFSFLEHSAPQRIKLICATDLGLMSWIFHGRAKQLRPVILIGAICVTQDGLALADAGSFALAAAARHCESTVVVLVRMEASRYLLESALLTTSSLLERP
jgi:hypothetical protein